MSKIKFLVFVVIIVLLGSCSAIKRRYVNGWYLSFFHKKHATIPTSQEHYPGNAFIKYSESIIDQKTPLILLKGKNFNDLLERIEKKKTNHIGKGPQKVNFLFKADAETSIQKKKIKLFNRIPDEKNDKKHGWWLLLTLIAFFLGLAFPALSFWALVNLMLDLFEAFLAVGVLFLVISTALGLGFNDKIKTNHYIDKRWPYKLVLYFALTILVAIASGIFLLLLGLLGFDVATAAIIAGAIFLIAMAGSITFIES